MAAVTARRASARREPVYLRLVELLDQETGELRACFVAAGAQEREVLRKRKLHIGDVYRAEIRKPRNPKHHRLVMATVAFLVDNCELFDTVDQALTAIKVGMGYCDPIIHVLPNGKTQTAYVVRSISFDSMDEDEFATFHRDLLRFITKRYLTGMTPEQVNEFAMLTAGSDT